MPNKAGNWWQIFTIIVSHIYIYNQVLCYVHLTVPCERIKNMGKFISLKIKVTKVENNCQGI